MNKKLGAVIMGLAFLAPVTMVRAEMTGHKSEFCAKHCKVEKLSEQVTNLTKEIEVTKGSTMPTGEKATTWMAKKRDAEAKLDKQIKELEALKQQLDQAEKELTEAEKK